jgi:prophage regulatory protein
MNDTVMRKPAVKKAVGNPSDQTLDRWEAAGKFPRRRQIGPGIVGWLASEIAEWLNTRPAGPLSGPQWTLEKRKAAHEKRAATMAARARANKSGSGESE